MATESIPGLGFGGGDAEELRAGGTGRMGRFARDEQGSFVILSLFLLITIFITAGIAVDAVRFEAQRARLQNTLDRAILAAADMSQSLEPEEVVASYFEKAGLSDYLATVTSSSNFNTKTVSATGFGTMDTFFMSWLGINQLSPAALGTAEESISDIEISLVLDTSGSMDEYIYETVTTSTKYGSSTYRYNTGEKKIEALKNAAGEFVDTIVAGTTNGRTSMSIVPYAAQVNVGPTLLSKYLVTTQHNFNHCVDFTTTNFSSTAILHNATLTRSDHLDVWYRSMPPTTTMCPTVATNAIMPLNGNPDELKARINGLKAEGNTAIDIGMKWGTHLLDPSARPVVTSLIEQGTISEDFAGRPFDYANDDTMKVIVVMTDGIHTDQYILNTNYKSQLSGVYRWWNGSAWRWSVNAPEGSNTSFDGDSTNNETYRRLNITSGTNMWASTPEGGSAATQLTYQEVFAMMSIDYHAYYIRKGAYWKDPWGSHTNDSNNSNRISSAAATKGSTAYSSFDNEPYTSISASTKNTRLNAICTAAKAQGIIVFAIGFEVTDASATIMQSCASSPSHFYRVNGLEITTAFQSIANAIGKLRLTQ